MSDLGVVFPVPPAYTEGGEGLDLDSTKDYIGFLSRAGATTVMTTAGTSQYTLLAENEIGYFNRRVARAAQVRGMRAIIGVPLTSTRGAVEFILNMHRHSADVYAFMVLWPERFCLQGMEPWLKEIQSAAGDTFVWLHAKPTRRKTTGVHSYSAEDIATLRSLGLTGIKEESMDSLNLPYEISGLAGSDFTVCLAGGSMRRAAVAVPSQNVTWLAGVGSFFPTAEISARKAWLARDMERFRKIQVSIEDLTFACAHHMGWHKFMRATMACLGLLPEHQRAPFPVDARAVGGASYYIRHLREMIHEADLDIGTLHS